MTLANLAERATEFDTVAPFNEATMLALAAREEPRIDIRFEAPGDLLIAAALAFGDAPVELVVDPRFRRGGLGRKLLDAARAEGETEFWAHGDLKDARRLAKSAGLHAGRSLLKLRRTGPAPDTDTVGVRAFRDDDIDRIIAINAAAFADHPEQGAMDRAEFDRRRAADWFDPAALLVLDRDGDVVGFHWTKLEHGIGEVYVIAVDPAHRGEGIGDPLLVAGLQHLAGRGANTVDLYVESDNGDALGLYGRFDFTEHARDVLYVT